MSRDRLLIILLVVCFFFVVTNIYSWSHKEEKNPLYNYLLPEYREWPLEHKCNSTIVTAYYKIRSKHSHEEYTSWMINFLSMRDCMVIFIDPELKALVKNLRPPTYPTLIIPRPIESSMVFKLLNEQGWDHQESIDPHLSVGHSKELYWIWNEKTNFMKIASEINPFSSSYFVWLDIGAVRETKYNHQLMVRNIPEEKGVLLLNVEPFTEKEKLLKDGISLADFSKVNHIGGGTIGCDKVSLISWHTAYYDKMRNYIDRGLFVGRDQNQMAATCLETDLCLLVRADQDHWFRLQEYFRGEGDLEYSRLSVSDTKQVSN